jgi:hypothetical protein
VATGKPYGAAPCLDGLPGGPVMRMRMLARARVITGNGLWASMTRSLRVDLMLLLWQVCAGLIPRFCCCCAAECVVSPTRDDAAKSHATEST